MTNIREKNKKKIYPNLSINIRGGGSSETKIHSASSLVEFHNGPFWQSTLIFTAANALGWVISLLTGSHVHLDLIGTGAFAVAGLPSLVGVNSVSDVMSSRIPLSGAMMTLWGTKLAGFLFFRALKTGHDVRLDDVLSTFSGTTSFWIVSLLWGLLCSLPHTLGTTSSLSFGITADTPITTKLGIVLYAVGIAFETLADLQKWNFKQSNPKGFCNVGVWSLSQHPNWFGNLLLWSGIFLINAPVLVKTLPLSSSFLQRIWGSKRLLLALLSPLFLWTLFSGQANGSITPALELANKKYGNDPKYQQYISEVPLIFPNPLKWFDSKS
eukprot:CAMPEP_0194215522 /NCGR_PEP_ID=MMETSP0156-20130528/17390_1 /TAXON_ID=33649 /ORGANISM="Thalassionema nitzschioides, Strain L26-B" /LENGTH=325 /DNA_ID=CAMNT_0038944055 /DNA_START=158 /DNA_END=1135 /DNA_ORIENTATION=+